jgi:hypothetical protein
LSVAQEFGIRQAAEKCDQIVLPVIGQLKAGNVRRFVGAEGIELYAETKSVLMRI